MEFHLEGEPLELPSRAVSRLAIVANELVTNAAKYCQPRDTQPCGVRVEVSLTPGPAGNELRLSVWNSGNPIPEGFDIEHAAGMGLRPVRMLVTQQYGGTFSLRPDHGGTLPEVIIGEGRLVG